MPLLLGVVPFGMIYGITALAAGMSATAAQATSALVFAGSAQFVMAQLIAAGAPVLVIVATVLVVNLRHMLYSISLAPHLAHLPSRWRALLAYLLTDEAYAASATHFQRDRHAPHKGWHLLGSGLTLWLSWQVSTALGIFLGAIIPADWPLDFALPLTFIALVVPVVRDHSSLAAALAAGIAALLAFDLPFRLGLIVAALIGMVVGLVLETWLGEGQRAHVEVEEGS